MVDPNIKSTPVVRPRLKARLMVAHYIDTHRDITDGLQPIDPEKDIYVVWFVKVLQNWKALLSTNFPDGMYYEVTYNGNECEAYLDAYKKFQNVTYKDDWFKEPTRPWSLPRMVADQIERESQTRGRLPFSNEVFGEYRDRG